MAQTEIYVDPAIAGNSGTGTIGDPYGDIQYALNTLTPDSTNGNRINIKAGTAEVLTGPISLTTYLTGHTPTAAKPLTFQGYTSAAGDGGHGAINTNGQQGYTDSSTDFVHWRHLDWSNSGASAQHFIQCDRYCNIIECNFNATNISFPIYLPGYGTNLLFCRLYNVGSSAWVDSGTGWHRIIGNRIQGDGNNATYGLLSLRGNDVCRGNVLIVGHTSGYGIRALGNYLTISGNIIYSSVAGTAAGIYLNAAGAVVMDNIIAGWSGAGGAGIESAAVEIAAIGYNAFHNCTSNEELSSGLIATDFGNDISLSADPFVDAANSDFNINATAGGGASLRAASRTMP